MNTFCPQLSSFATMIGGCHKFWQLTLLTDLVAQPVRKIEVVSSKLRSKIPDILLITLPGHVQLLSRLKESGEITICDLTSFYRLHTKECFNNDYNTAAKTPLKVNWCYFSKLHRDDFN